MNDCIKTKEIVVLVQENGIIRNKNGRFLARLDDEIKFDGEHVVEEKMYSNNELFRAFCHTFVDSDGKLELEMVEILMDRFNKFKENL